ncbi:MAG: T9SS type A sorting domain-containing protein, partial [Bacteroidales bacterium]
LPGPGGSGNPGAAGTPVPARTGRKGPGNCSKPDIAVDINGVVHLTYTDSHGSSGDDYTHPDIMYAYKSAADFVIQLIYRGYRNNSSSGSWGADYFSKGSNIAVNTNGDYFIIAHRHNIWRWPSGTDNTYYIMVNSNLGNGSVSNYGTDIFATYDMAFNGNAVLALYKQTTYKVSELTISGTDIGFSNTFDVLATSVSSLAGNDTVIAIGGISGTKLYTRHNNLEQVYDDIEVKNTTVSVVEINGVFYSVFTDNTDGKIKIREVAEPLSLTRFWFNAQTGPAVIDGQAGTIDIEVVNGTDLTNLIASFTSTSDVSEVTIGLENQTSGVTVNDFSSVVTYILNDGLATRNWLITVSEEPDIYNITTGSSPVEGGTTSGSGNYIEGDTVTVTASPNEGFAFVNWTEDGLPVSTDAEYSFTAEAERDLVAIFIIQHTITILTEGLGSVEVDNELYTGIVTVHEGTIVSLNAVAGSEYHFTGWSGDLTSTANPATDTIDGDKVITANFAINQYTVTIQSEGTGSVEVNDVAYTNEITVNSGTVLNLEAIAGPEYHFTGWSGDLTSTANPVSLTMDSNKNVTVNFALASGLYPDQLVNIEVFPNPFTDELHIRHQGTLKRIVVADIAGQTVLEVPVADSEKIHTNNLKKGIYFVTIELMNGDSMVQKVVKQ